MNNDFPHYHMQFIGLARNRLQQLRVSVVIRTFPKFYILY